MADPALNALQRKRIALFDIELGLMGRRTFTSADTPIDHMLGLLNAEINIIDGLINAAETPSLDPPTPAEATALQNAIMAAENAIAQNASVNNLLNAASVLIGTMQRTAGGPTAARSQGKASAKTKPTGN